MINLQYEIINVLQEELDKNTQNLIFDVSLNDLKSNSELQKYLNVPGTYAKEIKRFIPVIVEEITAEFAEIQSMSVAEYFMNMTLMLPTDQVDAHNQSVEETFKDVSKALNEMIKRTRANVFSLGDKSYLLHKDYTLTVDTNGLGLDGVRLDLEFTDNSSGTILTLLNGGELVKTTSTVFYNGNPMFNYEANKRYVIELKEDDGNYFWFVNDEKSSTSLGVITNLGSEVVLGGSLMKVYSIEFLNDGEVFVDTGSGVAYRVDNFITPQWGTAFQGSLVRQSGSEGTITLNFSLPRRVTNQFTLGDGLNYQLFEVNADGVYNDKAFVGQEIEYYINDVRIFPIARDEGFLGENDMARYLGDNQTNKSVIEQTGLSKEYTCYFEPKEEIINIMKHITSETPNANQVYKLKIVYPFFEREHDVLITQGGLTIVNSAPIALSFSLDIADPLLS